MLGWEKGGTIRNECPPYEGELSWSSSMNARGGRKERIRNTAMPHLHRLNELSTSKKTSGYVYIYIIFTLGGGGERRKKAD